MVCSSFIIIIIIIINHQFYFARKTYMYIANNEAELTDTAKLIKGIQLPG